MTSLRAQSLKDILTFTRASTATYCDSTGVLILSAIDEPRIEYDPVTLAIRGLLIEPSRTNYLLRSQQIDNASWTKTRSSITANAGTAPDGTTTADKLVEDSTASNSHFCVQNYTKDATTEVQSYTASIWIKAAERTQLSFLCQSVSGTDRASVLVDLSAGTVGSVTTSGDWDNTASSIEKWLNGWYRCSLHFRVNNDGETTIQILASLAVSGSASYSGDGASGLYLWGAQLEKGVYSTSYIPTTTEAVTRAVDVCYASPITPWFNEAEGTFFVEYTVPWTYLTLDATGNYLLQVDDESTDNRHALYHATGNPAGFTAVAAATQANPISSSDVSANTVTRLAYAWEENDIAFAITGQAISTDTSNLIPEDLTTLRVGSGINGGSPLRGHIRKVKFYPRRLSNNELSALVA